MKIRKLLSLVCLTAGLALVLPSAVPPGGGIGNASVTAAEEKPGTEKESETEADKKPGECWQKDASGWFYLSEGTKLTGLQQIGSDFYYFDSKGYRVTGAVIVKSRLHYFNPGTGKLVTGITGLQRIQDSNDYYFFRKAADGTIAMNSWVTHKGKKFYAGRNGKILFGTQTINGKLYHLTQKGRLTSYAKSSYNGKYYYAKANGQLKTGLKKIDGKYYYFSPTTGERMSGTITVGNYTYYFSAKGVAKTGWIKRDGKYYYHDSKGRRKLGVAVIDQKTYYLDPNDGGARVSNRWVAVNGKYYYFSSNGVRAVGWLKVDGATYYLGTDGLRKTGLQTINGKKYYFNPNGTMKTGWVTVSGNTYYMSSSTSSSSYGAAVSGWAKIDGKNYYFKSTVLLKGTWLYDPASKAYYYLDKTTGAVLTGKQTINGRVYDLGSTGAYKSDPNAVPSGPKEIRVNRAMNCITVYQGGTPIKAIVCSTAADGVSTPKGTFTLLDKLRWHELNGPSWGQYCSHITGDILFHSVPCTRYNDNHSLNVSAFNKLGTAASAGCIRLTVIDAKWIYDNCPIGTKVVIYDDWSSPGPLGKPTAPKITDPSKTWDPTDPNA